MSSSNWIIEPFSIPAKINNRWSSIRLKNGENLVGSRESATIRVNCAKTDRQHGNLFLNDNKLFLTDRSSFGTTVVHLHLRDYSTYRNNATPIRLLHGDWISFDNPLLHASPLVMQWFRIAIRPPEIQSWIDEERNFNEAERNHQLQNRFLH